MKMYLIGAVALSTTVTMATADIDFHVDFGQALGEGYLTSTMATDYDNTGTVRDSSGTARMTQSHSTQLNGSSMDITMRVDTIDGLTFRNSVLPSEQTQNAYDGTPFEVGSFFFQFGNYYLGQYGFGEQNGIDVGSEWEDSDGITSVTYFFEGGVSRSYVRDTQPFQIVTADDDPTEFHVSYGLFFNTGFEGELDFLHGDAIGIEITETIALVPAPGALALLGLGGLAARRRRG